MPSRLTFARLQTLSHPGSIHPWRPLPDESWRGLPIAAHLLLNTSFSLILSVYSSFHALTSLYIHHQKFPFLIYTFSLFLGLLHLYIFTCHIISYQRAQLQKQAVFATSLFGPVSWVFLVVILMVVGDLDDSGVEGLVECLGAFTAWNVVVIGVSAVLEGVYECRGKRGFGRVAWMRRGRETEKEEMV